MSCGNTDSGYCHVVSVVFVVYIHNYHSHCNIRLDCPRSSPGLVQPLFVDPRPGPGLVLDLDPRSGPGPVRVRTQTPVLQCNYFFFKLFVINIHIYIIIQKVIFLICALPNSLRPNFQLIFQNYESVDLLTFILPSK